jgi:hypothetical protein
VNVVARFRAPWSGLLMGMTVVGTLLLVGVSALCLAVLPPDLRVFRLLAAGLPLFIVVGCLPFLVRGYTITEHELRIQRLGWSTRWPLAALRDARVDPQAMKGSLRLCGNGGLFAFCGWFRNKQLGVYRAFATAPDHSVVLRFGARTVVVTPDDPAAFANELQRRRMD